MQEMLLHITQLTMNSEPQPVPTPSSSVDQRTPARHSSILDLDLTPTRSRALPVRVANSSVLVVAVGQEVSRCKHLDSLLVASEHFGTWRPGGGELCTQNIMIGINLFLGNQRPSNGHIEYNVHLELKSRKANHSQRQKY